MSEEAHVVRRRQFCTRCGQLMFEFYRSPDGHFGLVEVVDKGLLWAAGDLCCHTCGARYRLLDRADAAGQVVKRM